MTPVQKIQLRQSEIRSLLGAIAVLTGDDLTDEKRTERDKLMIELKDSEPQLRAAIEAEETEKRQRGDQTDLDGESAEYRSLCGKSRLARFVTEAHRQQAVDGAESELRSAVFGDGARPGLVPWEMLLPLHPVESDRREEHRADQITATADNAGAVSHPILARIFARTVGAYLGVSMESVERGVSAHPVITAGAGGAMKAKGDAQDAESATVTITSLEPRRLTARYRFHVEDLARIDGLEEALRRDLAGALGEKMDAQVVAGDGVAPNVQGIMTAIDAPDVPDNTADFANIITIAAGAVDGRAAGSIMETRILAGVDVYKKAGALFTQAGDVAASDYLLQRSGGIRATPHIANAPAEGARVNVGETLVHRTMAPGSAVAPMWNGFEMVIRDEVTAANEGEVSLTAIMLWNFKMLRAVGYHRASVKLA